jgi:hypothetical protein
MPERIVFSQIGDKDQFSIYIWEMAKRELGSADVLKDHSEI